MVRWPTSKQQGICEISCSNASCCILLHLSWSNLTINMYTARKTTSATPASSRVPKQGEPISPNTERRYHVLGKCIPRARSWPQQYPAHYRRRRQSFALPESAIEPTAVPEQSAARNTSHGEDVHTSALKSSNGKPSTALMLS